MAGLAAAHELAERGFRVHVYERKALGGKARSIPVPRTASGGRRPLPGEHGFRFFPGFYHHVPDSMRRTPLPGNEDGVRNNLVDAMDTLGARERACRRAALRDGPDPRGTVAPGGRSACWSRSSSSSRASRRTRREYFASRIMVFLRWS
jgi:uncharacterized protein with NAD-binding domain and iron-sulfur cluster